MLSSEHCTAISDTMPHSSLPCQFFPADVFRCLVLSIQENELCGEQVREEFLREDGRGIVDELRRCCQAFRDTVFVPAAQKPLQYADPIVSLGAVQKLLSKFHPKREAGGIEVVAALEPFRKEFHSLLGSFHPDSVLHAGICAWLNESEESNRIRQFLLAAAQLDSSSVPQKQRCESSQLVVEGRCRVNNNQDRCCGHGYSFCFNEESATLFQLAVWLGDIFCVELAVAVGANVPAAVGLTHDQVSSNKCRNNKLNWLQFVSSSVEVNNYLQRQQWDRLLVDGLEVQAHDCVDDRLLGQGTSAQVLTDFLCIFFCPFSSMLECRSEWC